MLQLNNIYKNVIEGLEVADDSLIHIYKNPELRILMEGLLIDDTTPPKVFIDLFGLAEPAVDDYRKYFFNIPKNTPRLDIFEFIHSIGEDKRLKKYGASRALVFNEVFTNGWEFIDNKFNRGRCVSVSEYSKMLFKAMLLAMRTEVNSAINDKDINKMKTLLGMIKAGTSTYGEKAEESGGKYQQLTLQFIQDIQDSAKKLNSSDYVQMIGAEVEKFGSINSSVDESFNKNLKNDLEAIKDKK